MEIRIPSFYRSLLLLLFLPAAVHSQTLEGVFMPGPVITGHAKWENNCNKCHKPFDKTAQRTLCLDCHEDTAADIRRRVRFHGRLADSTCRQCHTEHKGRDGKISARGEDKFDHDKTDYPLKGGHKRARNKCESCHKPAVKFRNTPQLCDSCHRKDDVHKGKLGPKCEQCHNDNKWTETTFDHDKTRYPLEGKHAKAKCKDCHTDKLYKDTPRDCLSCHKKIDESKGHKGHFGSKCENCHEPVHTFKESTFNHDSDTDYRLRGKHRTTECNACHKAQLYTAKTPTRCVACHKKDDDQKGHKGSLGDKCEACHNEQSWKNAKFDHDKETDYPLTGKHRDAKCDSCHKGGVTAAAGQPRQKLPITCIGCHREDDQKNKRAHRGKFGEKCETCHTTRDWKDITFSHDQDTKFLLRGKHAKTTCTGCHTGDLYRDQLKTECISCHRKDDQEKGHKGTLGTRCDACHNDSGWSVDAFDHNRSRFPLTGSHAVVECKKCHKSIAFKDAPAECYACHRDDDVHKRRLGTDCETCHNARTWKSWDYDHGKSGFRLDGAHQKLECYACHKTPMVKKRKPSAVSDCQSCHAKDDVHQGIFGVRCERCHATSNWRVTVQR